MLGFRRHRSVAGLGLILLLLAGCSSSKQSLFDPNLPAHMQFGRDSRGRIVTAYKVGDPYEVAGKWYYPAEDYGYREEGIASWYGLEFHGKRTANGEVYDMNALTAAHKTLPMPSVVNVTNLENGRALKLRINDRGPFVDGRIIDLSRRAAQLLNVEEIGTARVLVEFVPEDSLTLRNLALDANGMPLRAAGEPGVAAAPRGTVVSENLAPPVSTSSPGIEPPNIATKAQLVQPTFQQPSLPSAPRPSQPLVSQSSTPVRPPSPQPVATAPPSSPVAKTTLPSPSSAPPPVRQASLPNTTPAPSSPSPLPSPSVQTSSGPGINNLPSVSVSPPNVLPAVNAALQQQAVSLAPSPRDLLPSPKDLLSRQENGRLTPPENIQIPQGVFIQAGAFTDLNNARRLEAQLSGLGNVFVAMVDVGGQVFHRVRVGPIPDRSVADQLLKYMQTEGYGDARIVSE